MAWKYFNLSDRKWLIALAGFAGILVGVVGWIGFDTALHTTNDLEFCISCHEMRDTVYQEYVGKPHYSNPSGVRAVCADCHVPKALVPRLIAKVAAAGELWSSLTGTIATPEKFEAERLRLAKNVWRKMKETDSRECRSCHSFQAMDFKHQKQTASDQMQKAMTDGSTCIDCHKGIAHKLPDMTAGHKAMHDDLAAAAKTSTPAVGATLYTLSTKPFWLERPKDADATADGKLLPATPVKVVERDGSLVRVEFGGWSQEGSERMLYALQGKRIFAATLGPEALEKVARGPKMTDPDTDQVWSEGRITAWTATTDLVPDLAKLWDYGAEMYNASCGLCHALPPTGHYLANQWIGNLNAMKRFIALDDEQYRFLQKYVQLHAQDVGGKHE